jgi:hypothetical protein
MKTRQIPREEWPSFFKNLSQRQEGWEATLEVFGPDIGDQIEERRMYLTGLSAEVSAEKKGADKIAIMFGGRPGRHLTHTIVSPIEVDLQQTDLGIDSALQIKTADGNISLLRLF